MLIFDTRFNQDPFSSSGDTKCRQADTVSVICVYVMYVGQKMYKNCDTHF
jgi:hypothetical protein